MCHKKECPCSNVIDPQLYGDRSVEFGSSISLTGHVTKFYDQCYKVLKEKKKVHELNKYFLTLLEEMEIQHNCGGICKTNLFWFFKTAKFGPPLHDCRN